MKTWTFCKGCWSQKHMLIPIRGPLALPLKVMMGVRPSRMNPNICNICESRFSTVMKTKQMVVPVAVMFADIRGYTSISQSLGSTEVAQLLTNWYDRCAPPIWERDGIVNKLMGDALLAVFNFPVRRPDYVRQAVLAGVELQKKCHEVRASIERATNKAEIPLGIGIGICSGDVSVGEVGEVMKDFTIVGKAVNLSSRLQNAASAGEILVTEEVYQQVRDILPAEAEVRILQLKGFDEAVKAYSWRV